MTTGAAPSSAFPCGACGPPRFPRPWAPSLQHSHRVLTERFEVDVQTADQSVTTETRLGDLGIGDDPVPLPSIDAAMLGKVTQWCRDDWPPPPEDDETTEEWIDDIPVWDPEFLKVDQRTLFKLILAAD